MINSAKVLGSLVAQTRKEGWGTSEGSITFEQFKKTLAERFEDFTVGYQEQPTEQDLKDLYEDFLEFGKSLDEYLKDC